MSCGMLRASVMQKLPWRHACDENHFRCLCDSATLLRLPATGNKLQGGAFSGMMALL